VPSDYVVGKRQSRRTSTLSTTTKKLKRLKKDAIPSLFSFVAVQQPRRTLIRFTSPPPVYGPPTYTEYLEETLKKARSELVKTKSELVDERTKVLKLKQELHATQDSTCIKLSYYDLAKQEKLVTKKISDLEYLTGFNADQFITCFNFLNAHHMITTEQAKVDNQVRSKDLGPKQLLCLEDQFLLVLVRLRLNLQERDLAIRFNISEATVSRIFTRWINFMYLRLGLLPLWSSSVSVEKNMPAVFKAAYPTTYCIIDATELMCEVPASLCLQSQCYSSYKSHTTLKGLLAIAPNGAIIFVSQLYTGSISDRELTKQSGFLELLKNVPRGKSVMADKGFDIQDLLVSDGLLLNIPPFKGSAPLGITDVQKTQTIARVRIHVERVIGQVKSRYRILQGVIPLVTAGTINQIWTICCILTNFRGPIIDEPL